MRINDSKLHYSAIHWCVGKCVIYTVSYIVFAILHTICNICFMYQHQWRQEPGAVVVLGEQALRLEIGKEFGSRSGQPKD